MPDIPYRMVPVRTATDILAVSALFAAYVEWLNIDLAFQDFETELKSLPGKYAPPKGELWLARNAEGTPIGCIALRPLYLAVPYNVVTGESEPKMASEIADDIAMVTTRDSRNETADRTATPFCEIKRLYVSPAARGLGLGRALIATALSHAQTLAYREVRLDTLASMTAPLKLYREAGFVDIAPYYVTPVPDTVFLGRMLR